MTIARQHQPAGSTRLVGVNGIRLRMRQVGSGRPLLLLNGIGCSLETWLPVENELPGFDLLSFDTPGVGGSPTRRWPLPMPALGKLAVGLADIAGWDEFDVLGLSWGGLLAQQLAHDHPRRVRRLILCATTFGLGTIWMDPLVVALMSTPLRHTSRRFATSVAPYLYGSDVKRFPEAFEAFLRHRLPPSRQGYYSQALAATAWSSLPWLRRLRPPTLVMAGRSDRIVPPRVARVMARLIPNARLHLTDGGHMFLLLRTAEPALAIREFLAAPAPDLMRQPAIEGIAS